MVRRLSSLLILAGCSHYSMQDRAAPTSIAMEPPSSGEEYVDPGKNPWRETAEHPLSTFSADVDTASYTIGRRKLNEHALPPEASVRVEEYVNYFRYAFPAPAPGTGPFTAILDAAPSPFAPDREILRVAVGTQPRAPGERKPAHLVFLVDTSGSMDTSDKLPLAQKSLHMLVEHLDPTDSVALVTYAGDTRLVLPATSVRERGKILAAIDGLGAGGGTAMGAGIDMAYREAMKTVSPDSITRVIVCTDGDANIGAVGGDALYKILAERAKAGVTLSTVGFGMGNYKDASMEQLADKGNGNAFYVDSPAAAHKIFVEQLGANLEVVAADTKLQVEFDPAVVARYRLAGYENRAIADKDFRNDAVDAGEVGPGHQVTALYEIELTDAGKASPAPLAQLRIRWKPSITAEAIERTFAMASAPASELAAASPDLRFAAAVAAFADVLRGQEDAKQWSLASIEALARDAAGADPDRVELVSLIEKARQLRGEQAPVAAAR
ncbi:MAG TPA: von Willebrand factor type A domain-containing protein [Kofleriaceae bacterium]|jgi:Ca-activated chloride channel family protein